MGKRGERDESRRYDERLAENAKAALREFLGPKETQVKAAAALGYSQGSISRMVYGPQQPQLRTLLALREATHRSLDELLGLPPLARAPATPSPLPNHDLLTVEAFRREMQAFAGSASTSLLRRPTAREYGDTTGATRQLTLLMMKIHGDEQKSVEEWAELFKAKRKEVANLRRPVEVTVQRPRRTKKKAS